VRHRCVLSPPALPSEVVGASYSGLR
jgi:hypothetical protein